MSDFFEGWIQSDAAKRDSIDLKRVYIDMCEGNLYDAVIFSQIMYWHEPKPNKKSRLTIERGGFLWLAKGYGDWWEECRVNERTARQCIQRLEKLELIIKEVFHFNKRPTIHIRVNEEGFEKRAKSILNDISRQLEASPKRHQMSDTSDAKRQIQMTSDVISPSTTENTAEIPTETPIAAASARESHSHIAPAPAAAKSQIETEVAEITALYLLYTGNEINEKARHYIPEIIAEYSAKNIKDAVREAIDSNAKDVWPYAMKICKRWKEQGRTPPSSSAPPSPGGGWKSPQDLRKTIEGDPSKKLPDGWKPPRKVNQETVS